MWKLIRRPGKKVNYAERFAIYSSGRKKVLESMKNCTWIHAVSVGETNVALSFLKVYMQENPGEKILLSTTTTTGQEIAFSKAPEGVEVFFTPIDFLPFIRKFLRLAQPAKLIIFETELWPNMILETVKSGASAFLVNARLSDRSIKGYRRCSSFFVPLLSAFKVICAQTELDKERYLSIAPSANITVTGNIKFDQKPADSLPEIDLDTEFGSRAGNIRVLAASTHTPEEKVMLDAFMKVREKVPSLRFILVPRHAERGGELMKMLETLPVRSFRRSTGKAEEKCDILLADTTGELVKFYKSCDIVLMGKTFSGNREGQNIIEPAHLGKAIISGPEMINFRQAFDSLKAHDGVFALQKDEELADALLRLASDTELRQKYGKNAAKAVGQHAGALRKTVIELKKL
ncbi:MAG: 3-deoxy-D-manno-octulosonic acid transferase [Lentisphaeria bacterium]|nr:3-deoxy-D-manno-octulosonic acid transferase [Lentisphaeria bacterium]